MKMRVFSNNYIFSFDGDKKTIETLKLILNYHQKNYVPLVIELLKLYNPSALRKLNIKGKTYFYKESILYELLNYLGDKLNFRVESPIKKHELIPFLIRHVLRIKKVGKIDIPILAINHVKIGFFKWASIYYIEKIKGLFIIIDKKPRKVVVPAIKSINEDKLEIFISKLFLANLNSPVVDLNQIQNINLNPYLLEYIKLFYDIKPKPKDIFERNNKYMFCFSFRNKKYVAFFPKFDKKKYVFYDKSKNIAFNLDNDTLSIKGDLGIIKLHKILKGQLKGESLEKVNSGYYLFKVDNNYNNYFQNFSFFKEKYYIAYITKSEGRYIIRNPDKELWEVVFVDNKDIFLLPYEDYNNISKMNIIKSQINSREVRITVKNFLREIL